MKLGRGWLGVIAIAFGTALGTAVFLISEIAVNEFARSVRQAAGTADLSILGPRGGFNESTYVRVASLLQVAVASPVVEVYASVQKRATALHIQGVDALQAGQIRPDLFPNRDDLLTELFAPDTIILTYSAARRLEVREGESVAFEVALETVPFRVIGVLREEVTSEDFGLVDIAIAQWRFRQTGHVHRIDLRAQPGTDLESLRATIQAMLPSGVEVQSPREQSQQAQRLSRAYRVNLMILALVTLLTGAFLVFSTQALQVLRRRTQHALLRALGVPRRTLATWLLAEGALIGAIGAAIGVTLGVGVAALALRTIGADLGAGYFPSTSPGLSLAPWGLFAFWLGGTLVAIAGAALPALEGARVDPAPALRSGGQENVLRKFGHPRLGVALLLLAPLALALRPIAGMPFGGYFAIIALLLGALLLITPVAAWLLRRLPSPRRIEHLLARQHLANTPGHVGVSLGALYVSFAVIVAMAIMVYSFRNSVDAWLHQVLSADLYLRASSRGETNQLDEQLQRRIRAVPGIAEVDFVRHQNLILRPGRPPVALIARSTDMLLRHQGLPLVAGSGERAKDAITIWITEPLRDDYGIQLGNTIALPLAGQSVNAHVAGVWRDYARQFGTIVIDRADYARLTGDTTANDAAVYLAPDTSTQSVAQQLKALFPASRQAEISTPSAVRELSLRVFDRSFYVTYALEVVAVLVGLLGVSASFSAQVVLRRSEFGMLRHVGMGAKEIRSMLRHEGVLLGTVAVVIGAAIGFAIALVLVFVVNRQSFHWSMDLHMPWVLLASLGAGLVAAAGFTASVSARQATAVSAVQAVREDW